MLGIVLACTVWLGAQTAKPSSKPLPPSASKLIAIKVTGNKNFTEEQIIRESGLRLGQTATDDDFKAASKILGDTGAFSEVVYSFQYSGQGTKLDLQVTENEQLVPARFDNFVWFSDSELMDQLRTRVPLFQGKLPLAGELVDHVSDALQALLVEKNIPARADYLRVARNDGPIEAFAFRATGPAILVRSVMFSGAAPTELPLLEAAGNRLKGTEYMRSVMRVQAEKNFLPIYLARGYLKASFQDAQAKVAEQTPEDVLVDVNIAVDPGHQYKVSGIQLAGNSAVFATTKLQALIHQQVGQPANVVQLDNDIEALQKLYGSKGYMEASVKATPEIDESQSVVRYELQIHEGDVYKMGDLDIQGLDSRTTAKLVEEWKLTGNDPFDSAYLREFLQKALQDIQAMGDWRVQSHQTLNEKEKTVDVTLRFDPK
jgi:outer membrane protein assembly factor BamA